MRFTISSTLATCFIALATVGNVQAQDAQCQTIYPDYLPTNPSGQFQKCYTDQVYNLELVNQGGSPDYKELINKVCGASPCSRPTLQTAITNYFSKCNASLVAETAYGNVLQIGKSALEIYFAEPMRKIYCAEDPAYVPPPAPALPSPHFCLGNTLSDGSNSKFATSLAFTLTDGSVRADHQPFFVNINQNDVCSACSQIAFNEAVSYLSTNLMPPIGFYTPEFVQYWTKVVPAYNTLCKTSITQTWPKDTLNQTIPTSTWPGGASPTASSATKTATSTPVQTLPANNAGMIKPVTGAFAAVFLAALQLF